MTRIPALFILTKARRLALLASVLALLTHGFEPAQAAGYCSATVAAMAKACAFESNDDY